MSLPTEQQTTYQGLVAARLSDFFEDGRVRAGVYGPHFQHLWTIASQTVLGGKMVRPLLLLDTWEALSTSSPEPGAHRGAVIDLAVALELLHYSFLLHDDIIDGDLLRRGRPNLIGALLEDPAVDAHRAMHWARTGGILMGDLLLAESHQAFARVDLPHSQRVRLLDLLQRTVIESIAGEHTDVGLSDDVVPVELRTILAMTSQKTATYTFELPLRMAAIIASAPHGVEDRLGTIGLHVGLGFQLQDDLLSAFGDATAHGKDRFSDLREGKQTAIIAHARTTRLWPRIERLLGRPGLTESDAEQLSELLVDCGAKAFVEGLVEEQLHRATDLLSSGDDLGPAVRVVLTRMIETLRGRRA